MGFSSAHLHKVCAWRALCVDAKFRRIRLHDARHTSGTLMHMQGVPIVVISQWFGDTDPAFTMRNYVYSQDEALRLPPGKSNFLWSLLSGLN